MEFMGLEKRYIWIAVIVCALLYYLYMQYKSSANAPAPISIQNAAKRYENTLRELELSSCSFALHNTNGNLKFAATDRNIIRLMETNMQYHLGGYPLFLFDRPMRDLWVQLLQGINLTSYQIRTPEMNLPPWGHTLIISHREETHCLLLSKDALYTLLPWEDGQMLLTFSYPSHLWQKIEAAFILLGILL